MNGLEKLKAGDFNTLNQLWQSGGIVLITLVKDSEPKRYHLKVKDLYQPTETLISEEVIEL